FALEQFPEHYSLFKLTETSSATPTIMTVPTNVMKLEWVKYNVETLDNTDDQFVDMKWDQDFAAFITRQMQLIESGTNTGSFSTTLSPLGSDPVKFLYTNNMRPQCYSSPDDYTLIFDSIDTSVDTYLKSAKTM